MTYDEIKQRLTEVETALQSMHNTKSSKLETSYTAKSINNLNTLKESLQKQLAEKEETMFISTKGGDTKAVQMDRKTAMDLKKDPNITGIDTAKGQSLKELDRLDKNSGIEFDQNETAKIATAVGKSLALSLKKAGDELARMKAKRISPNSFDIEVTYKGEGEMDEFSFYVINDELHLVDFSFDKVLVDIGVKPSGEPIVNRDVLANELLKHFKSLNEEEVNEVNYDFYTEPKHFDICPGAESLRDELIEGGKSPEELGEWTFKHDELFKLEKAVLKANKADERHVKVANKLRSEIIHLSRDLGIEAGKINYLKGHVKKIEDVAAGKEIDEGFMDRLAAKIKGGAASIGQKGKNFLSYMKGDKDAIRDPQIAKAFAKVAHTAGNLKASADAIKKDLEKLFPDEVMKKLPKEAQEAIKGYYNNVTTVLNQSTEMSALKEVNEGEGDDHHYIKVSRRDYKKAMSILDNNIDPTYVKTEVVDDDGAGNVVIYFVFRHEYGFDDMYDDPEGKENPEFYQEPDEDPSAFVYDVVMDLQAQDIEVVDHSADMDENVKEGHGGDDLDVGHQDDEPGMLKSTSYEIATYAAKLYKKLAKYDQVDGEVDFPNWWQSKLILAKDYVAKAYHYLDSEEKQPIIDKLALEHALSEGTDLYDRNGIHIKRFSGGKRGLMVQVTYGREYIQIPADEFPILARAMQSVIGDLRDMSRQYPRSKNVDEIKAAKVQKAYGLVVAKMKELAKQYKAGDKSVVPQLKDLTAKKKALEADLEKAVAGTHHNQELTELTADQRNELVELQNILDDVAQKGEEAREIIRQSFPRMLSKADAYGAFDFGSSANRYDTTLESIIEEIEEYYDEEEDDMDEGSGGQIMPGDYVKNQHGDIYQRVDGKVGRHDAYVRVTNGKPGKRKTRLHDSFKLTLVNKDDIDEGKYKSDAQRKAIYAAKAEKNEAELSKAEKKKLKDMSKSLKKSTKGHAAQAKYLDKLVKEQKATCCGRCGRVHVKGTKCKSPYLKGKDHCRYN